MKPRRAASRRRRSSPDTRPQLAEQARPRRSRPSPAAIGRSRSDEASASARGRSRPAPRRTGRRRGWRRRHGCPGRCRPAGRGPRRAGPAGWDRGRRRFGAGVPSSPAQRAPGPRRGGDGIPPASARRRCRELARRVRRGRPGRDRSARSGRARPSRRHRPPRSIRSGSSMRAAGATRGPVALEVEHGIHEVLQGLGTGDRAVLRDVPDEDDGDPVALGQLHQSQRCLANLADAAGRPVELVDRGGLDRVDDERDPAAPIGPARRSGRPRSRRRPASPPRRTVEQAQSGGAKADLGRPTPRRSRRGRGHRSGRAAGDAGRGLEEEGRLADARLTADEDERSRDEAAAQDPVELADADRQARQVGLGDDGAAERLPERGRGQDGRTERTARARGRRSRRGCSTPRTSGTGLPSAGRRRRRTGRRSGSGALGHPGRRG